MTERRRPARLRFGPTRSPATSDPGLRAGVVSRIASGAWLLVLWMAITGSYTVAALLGGLIVVTVLMVLFRPVVVDGPVHRVRPWGVIRYAAYFLWGVVVANVEVAHAVIDPKRVEEHRGIVHIPLPPSSRLVEAVLANAVSLTPGTSIVEAEVDPPSLHVHVLHLHSVTAVRLSIAELHWRLVRALGPAEHLAGARRYAQDLRSQLDSTTEDGGDGS